MSHTVAVFPAAQAGESVTTVARLRCSRLAERRKTRAVDAASHWPELQLARNSQGLEESLIGPDYIVNYFNNCVRQVDFIHIFPAVCTDLSDQEK